MELVIRVIYYFFFIFLGLEIFINAPINGHWFGNLWSKDTIIVVGGVLSIIFGLVCAKYLPSNLWLGLAMIVIVIIWYTEYKSRSSGFKRHPQDVDHRLSTL